MHNRRRRRNRDITQWVVYGVALIVVILAVVLLFKGCKGGGDALESTEESIAGEAADGGITVDGISIDGMTQEEARETILEKYGWDMKVTYNDKTASVNNLMEDRVDELLEEIYGGSTETAFEVNTVNMLDAAKAEASLIAGNWSMVAKNGGISGYNKETGKFTFTEGTNGAVIDQDKLAESIVAAIAAKDYKAQIEAQVKEVEPGLTAAQLEAKYTTIATYTTTATNNKARNQNLKLSTQALNGTIVNPGQEFSFNETTGPRSTEKGYQPATAYLNGEIVQEPGGGVCQVSSTLYNAVVFAGLKSTERHAHSYEPSYVTPGEDAAVSYGGPDFKFVNNSDYPIAIKASFSDQKVTCSIYGIPVLDEGVKVRMESEKTAELDPPAPTYEEDQTLQPDEEKTVKNATRMERKSSELISTTAYTEEKRPLSSEIPPAWWLRRRLRLNLRQRRQLPQRQQAKLQQLPQRRLRDRAALQRAVRLEKDRKPRRQAASLQTEEKRSRLPRTQLFRRLRDQILQPMETAREIKRKSLL